VFVAAFHGAVAQRSGQRLPGMQQEGGTGDGDGGFKPPVHDGGPLARACKDIAEGKLCTVDHRHPGGDDGGGGAQEDPDTVGICQKMLDGGVHCHILHPSARACLDKVRFYSAATADGRKIMTVIVRSCDGGLGMGRGNRGSGAVITMGRAFAGDGGGGGWRLLRMCLLGVTLLR
jgi:hypothetical protein